MELSFRNASVSGRKKDLVDRLQAYRQNANFTGPVIGSPVKAEDLPTSVQPYISDPRPEKYRGMEGN
ncbi:hypothetical protein KUTeg_010974 [Tegillarca granosa]|uniref:SAP domain-containing protein n=1 Tax=Tegillarca granosa TaxID=220873 RepID=A0ABQ9F2I6_TEGGR|nr:hypothetical protein KUTeg_010974 [Tegillarca granosa]